MTEQNKQLLIKDLCARIPYHTFVQLNPGAYNKPETCILTGVHGEKIHLNVDSDPFRIDNIKPYLRPMSSMTVEEKEEFEKVMRSCTEKILDCPTNERWYQFFDAEEQDFMNAHHFDYRGLITMDLAIEAKEGMYKF